MSAQTRREFLKLTGSSMAIGVLGGLMENCTSKQAEVSTWTGFNYAMCNESMRELPWAKQCEIVAGAGYKGIEIASFTLVKESVKELTSDQRSELVKTMADNGLACAGLHWLLAPPPSGLHFTTPDKAVRGKTVDYLHSLIDFCSDLNGEMMIFGSPKQRNALGISVDEAKNYFVEGLLTVADHAQQRGVKILVEHLDHTQTDVVNTLAEAKAIVEAVNHPAIQMMFDFHNTLDETEPLEMLIKKFYDKIFHVHVQEKDGKHLGMGNAANDFVKAFQMLKDLGYQRWVSLEVFDFAPGGTVIAQKSMTVLKQIEAKLS